MAGAGPGRNVRFRRFCLFLARLEQIFPHRRPVERLKSPEGTYSTLHPQRSPCAVGTRATQVLAASDRAALKTCPGLSAASPGLRRRFLMAVRTGMGTNYPSGSFGGCGGRLSSLGADTG